MEIKKGCVILSEKNFYAIVYNIKGNCDKEKNPPLRVLYSYARYRSEFFRICWFDSRPVKNETIELLLKVIEGKIDNKEVKSELRAFGTTRFEVRTAHCRGYLLGFKRPTIYIKYYLIDKDWKRVIPMEEATKERFICGEGDLAMHRLKIVSDKYIETLIKKGELEDYVLPKEFYKIKYFS
jgi:hypothetical protein